MNTWDSLSRVVKDRTTGDVTSTDTRPVRDVYAQGMMAPQYSALTFPVAAGAHCIYEGELYAAKQDIAASEAWTAAHWDKVQLGAEVAKVGVDVADLKSAIQQIDGLVHSYGSALTPYQTVNGWKLKDDLSGLCEQNANYKLIKYQITENTKYLVDTNDLYQYQNHPSVTDVGTSNPYRLGETETAGMSEAPSGATYLIVTDTLNSTVNVTPVTGNIRDDLANVSISAEQVSESLSDIVQKEPVYINGSAFESGYIATNGTVTESAQCKYTQIDVSADQVRKAMYLAGSAWFSVQPYVFVGQSGTIITPNVSAGNPSVQYTDLEFIPTESGILYLNKYDSNNVHQIATAYTLEVSNIKTDMLPQPLPIIDVVDYHNVPLTMIEGRLLDGITGVISENESTMYRVSEYTPVTGGSRVMITTEHFWGNGMYAFYDENMTFISGSYAANGGTPTKLYAELVNVPKNASYIVIGFLYNANFPVCYLWSGAQQDVVPSKRWNSKKWVVIGDSLTEHNLRASVHYYDFVKAATGINVVNLAVSGQGYAKGSDNFMAQSLNVPTDADVVTMFGSFNDLSANLPIGSVDDTGTDTLAGCVNTAITNIQTAIPLVSLGIVSPTPWNTTQPSTSGMAYEYVEMLKAICERRSIPFLDLWRCSNLRPWESSFRAVAYTNDGGGGVHPDSNGHKLIAPRFKAFVESLIM